MANENDSRIVHQLVNLSPDQMGEFFVNNAHSIQDDSTYWSVLGTLWKAGGTVAQQDLWLQLFRSSRRNSQKIMKTRERRALKKLPKIITAYRAVNNDLESKTAISWSLSREVVERIFSENGKRKIVARTFYRSDIFAYFDRRHEQEILVRINQ